ncbi:MAG TPA: hypothetical protein VKX28_24210 [Xanthobacteraceae bacterium]|nr:hypothetical protein [Xanthobacteraceae bacterium]
MAQIQSLLDNARKSNSGPLAEFAGIYDLGKTCARLENPDHLSGTLWLLSKWLTWFEGDDFVFVQLLAPKNLVRGKLKFREDFTDRSGHSVKLYDVTWRSGKTDILAFLPDRQFFDVKVEGKNFSANYTVRCRNEAELLAGVREIVELP